jgi:hypothetical protein
MFCLWIEAYLKKRRAVTWNHSYINTDQYSTIMVQKSSIKMYEPQTIEKTPEEPSNTKSALNIKVQNLSNSLDNITD